MIRRSRAGLRYSAAMRVAILVYRSCCLPFALVFFSRPRSSTVVCSPSFPPVQSSFFSALLLLFVSARPRARFSSAFVPPGFLSSRKLACARTSIVNVFFCCTIFVKFLSVNWESYVRSVSNNTIRILFEMEKEEGRCFLYWKCIRLLRVCLKKLRVWLFKFWSISWVSNNKNVTSVEVIRIPLLTFLKLNSLKTFVIFCYLLLLKTIRGSTSKQWSFFLFYIET